ncbi:MAG: hypothetical protein HY281_12265 [Nitrospirae bacterium]|nr:hypothetical protein [Nitrospirota bacterium]
MLTMKTLSAFAICSFVLALSVSYGYPQPQAKSENNPTAQDKRGTKESPLIIQGDITTKASEKPESDRKQEEEKIEIERSLAKYAGWTAVITFVLVLVTGALAFVTYKLWRSTKDLATDAKASATQQAADTQTSLSIARQSADAATKAAEAALKTSQHVEVSDRAYIKISHDPPGLIRTTSPADALYSQDRNFDLHLEVLNIGKTPAELTRLTFTHFIHPNDEPLPLEPPYGEIIEVIRATMYGTDAIFPSYSFLISKNEETAISNRTHNLYILGVADYIDHFGIRHRAGYARRYYPHSTDANMRMVTVRGYNYDKRREPGDGHDWNDPI